MMLLFTPFIGGQSIPARGRLATAIAFSLFLYPLIVSPLQDSFLVNPWLVVALFVKEALFGFTIGFITMMVFFALESAGRVVDHQRGGANAEIFLPQLGQVSIFGLFNFWLAVALFLTIGGHRLFLDAFFMSYQTIPLLELPNLGSGITPFLDLIIHLSGSIIEIAVKLAAPVLIAILLVDIVLGLANKMAPQINVFELGFAVKGYMGPLMMYVSLLVVVGEMDRITKGMIVTIQKVTHLF